MDVILPVPLVNLFVFSLLKVVAYPGSSRMQDSEFPDVGRNIGRLAFWFAGISSEMVGQSLPWCHASGIIGLAIWNAPDSYCFFSNVVQSTPVDVNQLMLQRCALHLIDSCSPLPILLDSS